MADIDTNQIKRSDDPVWYFLAELSLSEISTYHRRDKLTDGLWVQTVSESGMPLDCVENIKRALTGLAVDAWVHFKRGQLEVPGRIRIFCPKKLIEDLSLEKIPRTSYSEYAIEPGQKIPYSGTHMIGGWGYFLIERAEDASDHSTVSPQHFIELYIYREGE